MRSLPRLPTIDCCWKISGCASFTLALQREMSFRCTHTDGAESLISRVGATLFAVMSAAKYLFDSRQLKDAPKFPCAQWSEPLPPHTVENLGPLEISIVLIELKTIEPKTVEP